MSEGNMADLVQQADDLYLRLVSMHTRLMSNREHMPTCDYKEQKARLTRLICKALVRMERRYFASEGV